MHIALITAKGSNQSMPDKNLITIEGKSFLAWQIEAASKSRLIEKVFISTEDSKIKQLAHNYNINILDRPHELAKPDSNHGDVILHAFYQIKTILNSKIDTLTVLLGNTISVREDDIDLCIETLMEDKAATSCMTVWQAQDDHPYRAMQINQKGYLESFIPNLTADTNRQSYPPIYFYDQGPWCVRAKALESANKNTGPACWWWMGDKCIPILRNWVTGRDIHTSLDVEFSRCFLKNKLWNLINPHIIK